MLHRRYVANQPEKLAELAQVWADDAVARKIHVLRTEAGLSQELHKFRMEVAARGAILKPGETWKDLAREGLD